MAHADMNSNNSRSLFIDTNLDTHFAIIVSHSDTVSDLKRKIVFEHYQCFPAFGDIKIDSLKVKRRGCFYHLSDSMLVKRAFATVNNNWFLSVDASRLAQGVGIQQVDSYKAGDQLALLRATDNRPVDQGSPSTHLTSVQTVNRVVSSVNQFTTGNSDKDYLNITEEDRPFDNEMNSKKRTFVQTESLVENGLGTGPSVEKKRKTEGVKASKDPGGENITTNNENSLENNIQDFDDESTRLDKGEKCSGMDQEATVVSSSIENAGAETHVQRNTESGETIAPDVFMALEKDIEPEIPSEISQKEKGESPLVQINSEASQTAPAVLMDVEQNIQLEIPSEISQKEKENELVKERVMRHEIPSSSLRPSDCELNDSENDITAEKEVLSTSLILVSLKDAADMSEKDLGSTVQESAYDQIDNLKEDKKSSRKQEPEVKLPRRKQKVKKSRNKDDSAKNKSKMDAPRISKSAHVNKAHGEQSAGVFLNQKSDRPRVILGLASVKAVQKSVPEVNKSQHVKSLLSGSETISGGDIGKSVADDNANKAQGEPLASDRRLVILGLASVKAVQKSAPNMNKSQHVKSLLSGSGTISGGDSDESSADDNSSPGRSSSSGEIASSINSRINGSAVKRKGGGGTSKSKPKNISMTDRVRSSPRFKRAKVAALQQLDTESEPVEFVPESPPI